MTQWYKKRTDVTARYVAEQCGILSEFDAVGDVIHRDDLPGVLKMLGIRYQTVFELFEPCVNPFTRSGV